MTILPKIKKVSATSTASSSSASHSSHSGSSSSSATPGPNGEGPSGSGVSVVDNRKRVCSERTGPDLSSLATVSPVTEACPPSLGNGPTASKRRLRDAGLGSNNSASGSDRRALHRLHLHGLHESGASSSSACGKKVSSTVQSQATGSCSSYPEPMQGVEHGMVGMNMPAAAAAAVSEGTLTSSSSSDNCGLATVPSPLVNAESSTIGPEAAGGMSPNSSPASPTGYNSGDEYSSRSASARTATPEQLIERERRFEKKLRKKGLVIVKMGEDGACLFRAVADQVYGDEEMHSLVRTLCCDYMTKNADYFSQYVTEEFPQYVARKRRDHIQGNHIELQALSEIYARPIEVYHYNSEPINIFQSGQDEDMMADEEEAIRLSYHTSCYYDSGHYNSVRTLRGTFKPKGTLLQFTPPHVLETAVCNSEADALEKAMLEDKIRATDWEATSEALEEQVARESYLEWVRESERRRRLNSPTLTTTSSSTITAPTSESSHDTDPQAGGSRGSCGQTWSGLLSPLQQQNDSVSANKVQEPPRKRWSNGFYYDQMPDGPEAEREILARVMLASRQEYLDGLKARRSPSGNRSPKSTSRGSTPQPSSSRT